MSKYKIKDLAIEISQRIDNPKTSGYERFVGLEHYDSGEVMITRFGKTDNLDSSVKIFKKGDILIARRNVYLKRAGLIEFDGVTSGDSIVIRANDEITKQLLPFIVNTKDFWDFANKYADGSMSKRLSPKILMEYETELPDSDEERTKLSDLLWSVFNTMISYKNLIKESDELVKSRFIEMFGAYEANRTIGELASICRGASPRPISNFITNNDGGENWIKIGDVGENDIYITHTAEKITKAGADKSRRVKPGDFILSNSMSFGRPYILGIDGCVHDGWLIISDYQSTFEPLFFYQLLRSDDVQSQFDGSANGACVRNLNSDLVKKVKVMTPPLELQKQFVKFFIQIDRSKYILQESIRKLEQVYKKIFGKFLNKED